MCKKSGRVRIRTQTTRERHHPHDEEDGRRVHTRSVTSPGHSHHCRRHRFLRLTGNSLPAPNLIFQILTLLSPFPRPHCDTNVKVSFQHQEAVVIFALFFLAKCEGSPRHIHIHLLKAVADINEDDRTLNCRTNPPSLPIHRSNKSSRSFIGLVYHIHSE